MSLYSYLPHLSDDLFEEAMTSVTEQERNQYLKDYDIDYRLGSRQNVIHLVCFSLCAPKFYGGLGLNDELLSGPKVTQLTKTRGFWDEYISSISEVLTLIKENCPQVGFRVYLASELEFIADRLSELCEVCLMKSSSSFAAAELWPLLGLEDHPGTFTKVCASDISSALDKIEITKLIKSKHLAGWRMPHPRDRKRGMISYCPMNSRFWGSAITMKTRDLLVAFQWAIEKGRLIGYGNSPVAGRDVPIFGAIYPSHSSDAFFLTTCIFPRLAREGILTAFRTIFSSEYLVSDVEFTTWINEKSYFTYNYSHYLDTKGMGLILPSLLNLENDKRVAPFYREQIGM